MPNKRDDFSEPVKRTAAERVAYRCSFPGCQMITIGASQEKIDKSSRTGVAAHICAAAEGGPRYDPNMTPEERKDITNCIWMCQTHAHLIDTDVVTYTVDKLKAMKKEAEEAATKRLGNAELLQFDNQNIELDKYETFLKRLIADGDYESLNYMLRRYNDLCVGNLQELIIRYKIHFDVYCCIDLLESDLNDYIALPNKSGINDLMELFICFLMPNELGKIISYCENEELKKYANKIIKNNIDSIFLRTKDCDTTTLEVKKDYLDMHQKALSNFIAQKNFALIKDTEGNYVNLYDKEFFYKVQASVVSLFRKGILNNIYYSDENNDENFVYIRDNLDKISTLDPCRQEYIWETILRYCMKNITKFNEFYDKCPEAVKQTTEMKGFKMNCDFVNDPLSVDENDIIKFAEDNNAYHILIEYVKSLSSEKRIEFLDEHQYLYRRDSYFLLLRLDLYPQKFESEEAFGLIDKYKEAHKDDFLFHCLRARVAPEQERKKEDEWLKRYNDQIKLQQLKMYFDLLTYEKDFDTLSNYINAPLPNEDLYYLAMCLINSESLRHLNQTHAILEKLIEQKFIVNGIYHNLAYIDNKLGRASQTKEFLAKEYDKNQSIESLLRLLFLRFETKDFQEDKYLNAASEIIDEEAQVLVGLTYLNLNKKEEAKPHLLKALFLNDSSYNAYLGYYNACEHKDHEDKIERVSEGTVCILKDEQKNIVKVGIHKPEFLQGINPKNVAGCEHYSSETPIASNFLFSEIGDKINYNGVEYEIVDIKSIDDIISACAMTRFVHHPSSIAITGNSPEEAVEKIKKLFEESNKDLEKIIQEYNESEVSMPIVVFSYELGKSKLVTCNFLSYGNKGKIRNNLGKCEGSSDNTYVLSYDSILRLHYIQMLDVIINSNLKIICAEQVKQQLIADIDKELSDVNSQSNVGEMSVKDGSLCIIKHDSTSRKAKHKYFSTLKGLINKIESPKAIDYKAEDETIHSIFANKEMYGDSGTFGLLQTIQNSVLVTDEQFWNITSLMLKYPTVGIMGLVSNMDISCEELISISRKLRDINYINYFDFNYYLSIKNRLHTEEEIHKIGADIVMWLCDEKDEHHSQVAIQLARSIIQSNYDMNDILDEAVVRSGVQQFLRINPDVIKNAMEDLKRSFLKDETEE